MFLKYFDFIFAPFRAINNKIMGVKQIKGNIQHDINRSKSLANQGQQMVGQAQQYSQNAYGQQGGQGMQQPGQPGYPAPGMQPGAPGMPPGAPQGPNPNPPVVSKGFWLWAKKFCSQCGQQLDKSWDACPYCAQIAVQVQQAPAKAQAMKTQAFVIDAHGGPGQMQLLGWIVPLQGPQRGELFTLSPNTTIGTDPKCTIVLNDKFMSSKHAEIKAEGGVWILKDGGSTNGTYVNDKRVDKHELVDNDFIKFGGSLVKFKSL